MGSPLELSTAQPRVSTGPGRLSCQKQVLKSTAQGRGTVQGPPSRPRRVRAPPTGRCDLSNRSPCFSTPGLAVFTRLPGYFDF